MFDELFPLVNERGETWDPISGIKILSDDKNVQTLLFQILLNAVRGTNGGTVWILKNQDIPARNCWTRTNSAN